MKPRLNAQAGRGPRNLALARHYELLRQLVRRNLKVKYQRSFLGFVWTLTNPILMIALLTAVFTHILRVQIESYWAFLVSGYFAWTFVQNVLNAGTYTLSEHAELSRNIALPPDVLLMSSVLSRLFEFAVELALVAVILAIALHGHVPASYALLPVLLLLAGVLALGLQLPIATLAVFFHDVQHAVPILVLGLFYASPVIYPIEMVPESLQPLYTFNPLAYLLPLFQQVLYAGLFPSLADLAVVSAVAFLSLAVGYVVLHRFQGLFAEIL